MAIPSHVGRLTKVGQSKNSACGRYIEIWELNLRDTEAILSEWAAHFRNHYISDADLPEMVAGTGKTNAAYLRDVLFPDAKVAPGPSLRSGDFGEILVADYIEYVLGYWCPRELRYQQRWNRNDSTKGCDVIGFRFVADGANSPDDELFIFETKSGMSKSDKNRLQDAVADSDKDKLREAMTLNAIKQKFLGREEMDKVARVARFQNMADRPFRRISGAAAILDDDVFAETDLSAVDASNHYNSDNIQLIVFKGPSLMQMVNSLYERAADEA